MPCEEPLPLPVPDCEGKLRVTTTSNSDGTRTRNPQIRSLIRYPLRHGVLTRDAVRRTFLGSSVAWMFGSTPPDAIVTEPRSLLSSSSLRTASWMWRGTMRCVFLLSRGVARELEDLGAEVLEDGAHVDAGADADPRGVLALAEVAVQARHRELEAGLGRRRRRAALGLALALAAAAFSFARHDGLSVCLRGAAA